MKRKQKKILYACIVFIFAIVVNIVKPSYEAITKNVGEFPENFSLENANLQIFFFDVGQADSILVINDNKTMLIDAGNNADGALLVQYIEKLGISKIDYVIGTHAHEDHIGGLDDIVRAFDVDVIYMPYASEKVSTETYKQVQEAIYNKTQEDKTLVVENPKINTTFSIGDAECIVKHVDNNNPENINNSSIVIEMTAEKEKYLFMGDSEKEVENGELNAVVWDDIDVLKVGHHGSDKSTTQRFIDTVLPEIAIISVRKK